MPVSLGKLLPPTPLARRLSAQSMLYAIGDGAFFTGSAVFFTQIVGISAAQVGLGLSAALATSFVLAVPLGKLADRFGPKQTWAVAGFAGAGLFAVWPFVHGFAAFLAVAIALESVATAGRAARGAYAIDAFDREERVRSMAYMRASLNIGFTLGALIGGVALGLVENWGAIFFGSQWKDVIAFVILVVVLLFRPTGILGESLQQARA